MDQALKQRLVGAIVLIIFAVIVLPMLLSGRSDTLKQESRQIELPSKPEELSFETRRFPVGQPTASLPAKEPDVVKNGEGLSDDTSSSSKPDVESPAVTNVIVNAAEDDERRTTETVSKSVESPRYLVQVASFGSIKKANALADRLRADNFSVLMDVVERTAGRLHRVRIGPYIERREVDTIVASLRSSMQGLSPRVVDLRPTDMAPVSTPSDPLVRWVVQVGSFSSAKRAEDQLAELRLAGLSAFSEKVSSTNGVVYKVRLGPEIDREKAVEMALKIKVEHNLDGFVTTHD